MNKEQLIEIYGLEYVDYLDEIEGNRNHKIERECKKGNHSWQHFYGGDCACSTCGEELNTEKKGILRTKLKTGLYPWELEPSHALYHAKGADPEPEQPSAETLEEWMDEGGCETVTGCCWVEPDGTCSHGRESWLLHLGLI